MSSFPILIFIFATFSVARLMAQEDPIRTRENDVILNRIEASDIKENLGVLQATLDHLPFRSADPERYANMVYAAFFRIYEQGTEDMAKAHRLEQRYVLSALDRPDMLSVEAELRLVLKLRVKVWSTGASAISTDEVREKTKLLFHAWRRMEREIDPTFKFDFGKMGVENLPPRGQGGISGMDPADIQDTKTRNEYLADLEENRKLIQKSHVQMGLRNIREPFIRNAEDFLVAAVRTGAVGEAEVLSDLNLVQDESSRNRVVAKLRATHVE